MNTSVAIKRRTVTSSVIDLIRDRIISGHYKGGQQIRQEAIAEEAGVSRIPIREALLQLEAEGLVVIHTHRGAVVAALTIEDAIDIFEARIALEPFILKKAIEQATEVDVANVQRALKEYSAALRGKEPPARLSELNWDFHKALSRPAKRPRSLALLSTLYASADRYLRLQIDARSAQKKALDDHQNLAEAFATRDQVRAQKLLKKHIADARDDVIAGLNARSDSEAI